MKKLLVFLVFFISNVALAISPKILFYSHACPHCQYVQNLIKQNHVAIEDILQKEVVSDLKNQGELVETLRNCNVTSNTVNLPVLWTGSKCLIGKNDVIDFLQKNYHI